MRVQKDVVVFIGVSDVETSWRQLVEEWRTLIGWGAEGADWLNNGALIGTFSTLHSSTNQCPPLLN